MLSIDARWTCNRQSLEGAIVDDALTSLISEDVIGAEVLVGVANDGGVFFAVFTSSSLIGVVPSPSFSFSPFSVFAEIVTLVSLTLPNPS